MLYPDGPFVDQTSEMSDIYRTAGNYRAKYLPLSTKNGVYTSSPTDIWLKIVVIHAATDKRSQ